MVQPYYHLTHLSSPDYTRLNPLQKCFFILYKWGGFLESSLFDDLVDDMDAYTDATVAGRLLLTSSHKCQSIEDTFRHFKNRPMITAYIKDYKIEDGCSCLKTRLPSAFRKTVDDEDLFNKSELDCQMFGELPVYNLEEFNPIQLYEVKNQETLLNLSKEYLPILLKGFPTDVPLLMVAEYVMLFCNFYTTIFKVTPYFKIFQPSLPFLDILMTETNFLAKVEVQQEYHSSKWAVMFIQAPQYQGVVDWGTVIHLKTYLRVQLSKLSTMMSKFHHNFLHLPDSDEDLTLSWTALLDNTEKVVCEFDLKYYLDDGARNRSPIQCWDAAKAVYSGLILVKENNGLVETMPSHPWIKSLIVEKKLRGTTTMELYDVPRSLFERTQPIPLFVFHELVNANGVYIGGPIGAGKTTMTKSMTSYCRTTDEFGLQLVMNLLNKLYQSDLTEITNLSAKIFNIELHFILLEFSQLFLVQILKKNPTMGVRTVEGYYLEAMKRLSYDFDEQFSNDDLKISFQDVSDQVFDWVCLVVLPTWKKETILDVNKYLFDRSFPDICAFILTECFFKKLLTYQNTCTLITVVQWFIKYCNVGHFKYVYFTSETTTSASLAVASQRVSKRARPEEVDSDGKTLEFVENVNEHLLKIYKEFGVPVVHSVEELETQIEDGDSTVDHFMAKIVSSLFNF